MLGKESHYAVQINRYFLIPIGIWPIGDNATLVSKILQKLSIFLCYGLICFLLVPCALHTFIEEPDPAIKLKLIGPMSFCLMAIGKYCSLVGGIDDIGECFEHVEQDWKSCRDNNAQEELVIMKKKAKLGRFLALLCAAFMYGGGFFYHTIMPLSSGKIVTTDFIEQMRFIADKNNTDSTDHGVHGPRALTYPIYRKLMNVDESPTYEIVFIIQFASGFVLYTITIGACSLAAVFVVHVCGQLEIVMRLIKNFANNEDQSVMEGKRKMAEIVERHLRALKFAEKVEDNLNVICFVEFIGCTMNICFLGYYCITEWEKKETISIITYFVLLISFMFNILVFCIIGEIIVETCNKVGEVTYTINWYNLPKKSALDLIMILTITSCRPAKITAYKLVTLSMSSFCNVIKSAATYLNLLRTVML